MDPNIIIRQSALPVTQTIDKLERFLRQQGVTIYARIDQQEEAAKSGITLQPLEFLLFGNPQKGGTLMAVEPMAALDLPLKLIAWEDGHKKVYIAYNQADYIGARYGLNKDLTKLIDIDALVQKVLSLP
jgi:uncharacterized protein (DUF302 family)